MPHKHNGTETKVLKPSKRRKNTFYVIAFVVALIVFAGYAVTHPTLPPVSYAAHLSRLVPSSAINVEPNRIRCQ